jgi:hypothetical protein
LTVSGDELENIARLSVNEGQMRMDEEGKDEALTVVDEERQFLTPKAGSHFDMASARK